MPFGCVDALDALLRVRPDYFATHEISHQSQMAFH